MADSATRKTADSTGATAAVVAVAYSGGRDSTALLHVTAARAPGLGVRVAALHVHHGLSPHADEWLEHCHAQCEAWGVDLHFSKLQGAPAAGQSVEAWARAGRHTALAVMAQEAGADLLLLAQHRRDQAETYLLQSLRGAGVAGQAAMPAQQWREGLLWARPWLRQPREAVEQYLTEHGLRYIDDDSNSDPRFARNRLRLQVWPALTEAFAATEPALAQAAQWAQQALDLQDEMLAHDLAPLRSEAGLDWPGLRKLSPARATNALRGWLAAQLGQVAPASLVLRLLAEADTAGSWPAPGGLLHLYRGWLSFTAEQSETPAKTITLDLSLPGAYAVPAWRGRWQIEAARQGGLKAEMLARATLRPRAGAEQFQVGGMARSLKKCFQAAGVPAWLRSGPLLYCGERLAYVPGLGVDARLCAAVGEPQLMLEWQPDAALEAPM